MVLDASTSEAKSRRAFKRVFICAGEKSGDLHAAHLIRATQKLRPDIRFEGFGGEHLEAAGCHLHENIIHLSSMGLSFLSNVFAFVGLIRRFYRIIKEDPPEVLVLVDLPGFNFILARIAKWSDIPVVYYICPQIWAWAPWRRKKILRLTDLLMVILPFEEEFYRDPKHRVVYVGHPLADELAEIAPPDGDQRGALEVQLRKRLSLDPGQRIVGLFPGSRDQEVHGLLPVFRRTIDHLRLDPATYRLVVSCCRSEFRSVIESEFQSCAVPVDILEGEAYSLMATCRLALVASGTATLELAYFQKPMVVFYKLSRFSHFLYHKICTSPFVSLVNILGKEEVVPEDVTWRDNSADQAERARPLLNDTPERQRCLEKLRNLGQNVFRPGGSERAARVLSDFLVE